VPDIDGHLVELTLGRGPLLVMDIWSWDDAVGVIATVEGLHRLGSKLREIYPDGLLLADPDLSKALLVDFDEGVEGADIAVIQADVRSKPRGVGAGGHRQ
jgi:hypothetical protein